MINAGPQFIVLVKYKDRPAPGAVAGYVVLTTAKNGGVNLTQERRRAFQCSLPLARQIAKRLHDGLFGEIVRAERSP